jgi:hypothetical protein
MSFCSKELKSAAIKSAMVDAGVASCTSRVAAFYLVRLCFTKCSTAGTGHFRLVLDGVYCP